MSRNASYEIYIQKGRDWTIAGIHEDKAHAVSEARALFDQRPGGIGAVQVIEEVVDTSTGEARSAIVFKAVVPEDAKPAPDLIRGQRRPKEAPVTEKPRGPASPVKFTTLVVLKAVGIGLAALGTMILMLESFN